MKIKDFIHIVEQVPKINEGQSIINPLTYFIRLYEANDLTIDNEIQDFFDLLQSDGFFKEQNMPKDISIRSYVSALKCIQHIINFDKIKQILDEAYNVDEIYNLIEKNRKYYSNLYKKQQRQKVRDKINEKNKKLTIVLQDDEGPHIQYLDESIRNVNNNQNDNNIIDEGLRDNMTNEGDVRDKPMFSDRESIIKERISYIVSLLDKYMNRETDEFKKIYIDVVKEQVVNLLI